MNSRSRWHPGAVVTLGQICLLAAVYYLAGRIGLALAQYHHIASLVWPPTGIALAALILYGTRLWPGVFLGAFFTATTTDAGWLPSLGISAGETLEAVVCALLLLRYADFRPALDRLQDAVSFLLLGAIGCTVIGATVGVSALWLSGGIEPAEFGRVWLVWWAGNAAGAVIFAPPLFMLMHGTPPWRFLLRRMEFWLMLATLACAGVWAFGGIATGPWAEVASFAPFPFLVWAGSRLGPRGAVTASFSIMVIATLGTALDLGPFAPSQHPNNSTLLLWAYGVSMGSIAYTLAAVIGQRDSAERLHRSEEAERTRIEQAQALLLERERIMREMHDGLGGQLVSTIAMVERGRGGRSEIVLALRQALDDMRIVIDTLDPNADDLRVSLGKLRARLEPLLRRNGIRLGWEIAQEPVPNTFTAEQSLHLLRIIQEAVTNVIRHSGASRIDVRISRTEGPRGSLSIEIRDDGHGVSTEDTVEGRGILNMKARAAALDAEIRIDPAEPGTRVVLTVPCAN